MIIAAFEGGKIMKYFKKQDSLKIQYSSDCLPQEGAGEVQNLRVSPYSNHFIVIAEENIVFDYKNKKVNKIGRVFDFLDENTLFATNESGKNLLKISLQDYQQIAKADIPLYGEEI
jgi:hypothetical protein